MVHFFGPIIGYLIYSTWHQITRMEFEDSMSVLVVVVAAQFRFFSLFTHRQEKLATERMLLNMADSSPSPGCMLRLNPISKHIVMSSVSCVHVPSFIPYCRYFDAQFMYLILELTPQLTRGFSGSANGVFAM